MIREKIEIHDELNPKLFDENQMMRQDVKEKLLQIVEKFKESLDFDLNIIDVIVVGSNASFNYTDDSDIDLHIIVNTELMDIPKEYITILFNSIKSKFNSDYEIKIRGLEVELYLEDTNTSVNSNGIYSVMYDKWVKKPKPLKEIEIDISDIYPKWEEKVNYIINNGDAKQIQDLINKIHLIRRNSVNSVGEFGRGNYLFKELRNNGYMDKLRARYKELVSKELSLEHLQESTKNALIQKSKNSPNGMQRLKKRTQSKVSTQSRQYNNIDMNKLFGSNILTVSIPVRGETDNYVVKLSFGGVIDQINSRIRKDTSKPIDLKLITTSIIQAFNSNDVYVNCNCPDFKYRFGYYATKTNINSGEPETRPSKITNPNDKLGSSCKHTLCVLSNTSWIIKCAIVIYNYINYIKKNEPNLYKKLIYPKLYQVEYKENQENNQ